MAPNEFAALAERMKTEAAGKTVLYAGHSNTVPALIQALGVPGAFTIGESDYDDLFLVSLLPGSLPTIVRLHTDVQAAQR